VTTTSTELVDTAAREGDTRRALDAVKKAGRTFTRKQKARDDARDALFEEIRKAAQVPGVTRIGLINSAGVARQTVFDALKPLRQEPDQASDR
jgi:hypothetical protein